MAKACHHRRNLGRVLVVGDGDFSFSAALAATVSLSMLVSTSLDSAEQLRERYSRADKNISALLAAGHEVRHGVDGTKLAESLGQTSFDTILFNYPHIPGKAKINKNRQLLAEFFCSAAALLSGPTATVCVALCAGQGGTGDVVDSELREWQNSWQITAQAAEARLVLTECCLFEDAWPEVMGTGTYNPSGNRAREKAFKSNGGVAHWFHPAELMQQDSSVLSLHPPRYSHDWSFWLNEQEVFDECRFFREVREMVEVEGPLLEDVSCIDEYTDKASQRQSRTYRLVHCSRRGALSRTLSNRLQRDLVFHLESRMGLEPRSYNKPDATAAEIVFARWYFDRTKRG